MPSWFPYPIRYVGDCSISGHGYSMRGYLAALQEVGIGRDQIDIMPWPPAMSLQEDWFFDRFLRLRDDRPNFDSGAPLTNIIDVRLADVRHLWTKGWHNIVVASWNRLPAGAEAIINRCEEVWATSETVAAALRDRGVTSPIFVIPCPVQPAVLEAPPKHVAPDIAPEVHPHFGPHEFKHTSPVYFYYVGRWSTSKNIETLLQAYFAAGWSARDPVELLLHCPPSGNSDVVVHSEIMRRHIDRIRSAPPPWWARRHAGDASIVRPLSKLRSHSWVCKLHKMNHVFVSADLSESISTWEAAAIGNLVIVPESVEPLPGALTYADSASLTDQFKVAFDLIRSGWRGADGALQARKRVSPAAVGELLKQRLTALKDELEG